MIQFSDFNGADSAYISDIANQMQRQLKQAQSYVGNVEQKIRNLKGMLLAAQADNVDFKRTLAEGISAIVTDGLDLTASRCALISHSSGVSQIST